MANLKLFSTVTINRSTPKFARVSLLVVFCLLTFAQVCSAEKGADSYDALYDVIMTRKGLDGKSYGLNSAVPLLWNESSYLLDDDTHKRFIEALDNFSALSQREIEAYGNVKRALLQRDPGDGLVAFLRFEDETECNGQIGSSTLAGELHETTAHLRKAPVLFGNRGRESLRKSW